MTPAYAEMYQHSVRLRALGITQTGAQLANHLRALGLSGQSGKLYVAGRAIHNGMKAAYIRIANAYGKPEAESFARTFTDINGNYPFEA